MNQIVIGVDILLLIGSAPLWGPFWLLGYLAAPPKSKNTQSE